MGCYDRAVIWSQVPPIALVLHVSLSLYLFIYLPNYLSIYPPIYLYVYIYIHIDMQVAILLNAKACQIIAVWLLLKVLGHFLNYFRGLGLALGMLLSRDLNNYIHPIYSDDSYSFIGFKYTAK